jgi:hypothetical protein
MTAEVLVPWLTSQFFTNNGQPLAGGQLFSYQAGTSTPVATWTDSTGSTPNTNPVIANSRGEMSVWITNNVLYKFVLEDAAGNTIWTRDQVSSTQLLSLSGGTDTGSASLYILNFLSPFTTLAAFAGTPIFFIPANNNSAAPSINVNGLGVVNLYNANGSPLGANQILAGQITEIVYQTNIAGTGNSGFVLMIGGSLSGSVVGTFGPETPIASATTTDLGTVPAHNALVTGTTTITGFGSSASLLAPIYIVRFAASLTLTNSATLTLPGNANIVTQPGDSLLAEYGGSGSWRVLAYFSALGSNNNAKIKPGDTVISNSTTLTPDPDLQSNALTIGRYSYELMLIFDSVTAGDGFKFQSTGTAVDSRGISPVVETGWVNGAADGPKQSTFYNAPITYATVGAGADSNQVIYKGSLLVSTPGTFGIEWAQNSATAAATTLRAGSYLTMNLLNTGTASGVTTRIYQTPGTFVETVPTGFNNLTIEVFGASGGGGARAVSGGGFNGGGGGASGPYSRTTVAVTGLGGDNLNFTVGSAGVAGGSLSTSTSVSSGTLAITTITCPGGPNGGDATSLVSGVGGVGPTSTGGTVVNTPGNSGSNGNTNPGGGGGGNGGFGIAGIFDGGNSGGKGAGTSLTASNGGVGIVVMSYS